MQGSPDALRKWARTLPYSRILYPDALHDQVKYYTWLLLTPIHPYLRDTLDYLGVLERMYAQFRPNGRQHFLLGTLASSETHQSLALYLVEKGYANHFVALKDRGEIVSLRYTPSFKYQYHIRIFDDGEVRAHYEYTPECHPFWHDREVSFEPRRDYFLTLLGDKITPTSNR
ncbi:hypothetical protein A2704_00920 [Candidatus Kaiserbacteria bacterium RIFCSPHIGHO2_01_FULL_54_36b]|uniref:Uncharacterized protein n=1 Tax=Candidatus Kaiserbacteria bacterium RIFCSPHIGHO2_01_FULL_54_36b TaxID=1798483 RepID=A0A1F6CKK4_9BACT|nr:MAG: hypothetical protein A2704_00920 [Candidatus Kaiserbacteria bacterium RIFCSPHIGHO2_01_FULL_54_36b]